MQGALDVSILISGKINLLVAAVLKLNSNQHMSSGGVVSGGSFGISKLKYCFLENDGKQYLFLLLFFLFSFLSSSVFFFIFFYKRVLAQSQSLFLMFILLNQPYTSRCLTL